MLLCIFFLRVPCILYLILIISSSSPFPVSSLAWVALACWWGHLYTFTIWIFYNFATYHIQTCTVLQKFYNQKACTHSITTLTRGHCTTLNPVFCWWGHVYTFTIWIFYNFATYHTHTFTPLQHFITLLLSESLYTQNENKLLKMCKHCHEISV